MKYGHVTLCGKKTPLFLSPNTDPRLIVLRNKNIIALSIVFEDSRHTHLKSFPTADKDSVVLYNQYQGSWWLGDTITHGISSHGIDIVLLEYPGRSTSRINSLWPSDTIWWHKSGSTLAQVMACCLTAPSHYLNQCWLISGKVQWHPSESNFTRDTSVISHWN